MSGNISLFTYGTATLGFALLAVLLVAQWRVRPLGPGLVLAASASALWAGTVAAGTLFIYPPIVLIQLTEIARNASWLFFLLQLLSFQSSDNVWVWMGRRWLVPFIGGVIVAVVIVSLRPLASGGPISPGLSADLALMLWLGLAIVGLLLVEQVYRNASSGERWGVKFLCLGLGALFAYDFFMYAEALLFRQLDTQLWRARGLVNAVTVPWLVVAIARNRNWRMDVHVSRHVVFHTVTLMGAGLYLLCMAVIGYFIKYLGGSWGGVLQVSFLAASGALLLTLLFSGTLRARLRVWLAKHFFSYRYDYREEWLRFTDALASLENIAPGVIRIMAGLMTSPGGLLLYRGAEGKLSEQATWELDAPNSRDLGDLPAWIQASGWVVDLEEWRRSPDLYDNLALPSWVADHETLWLIVPLFFQGQLEAVLFLDHTDLKDSVNWEDRDLLKTAGRQAAALLAQQRASQGLVEARQFDAFNRLSAYVIHDLKNILAQQSLLVSNAEKHRSNPAFVDDMIATVDNSVKRMQRLMDQMRSGMRTAPPKPVDLAQILNSTVTARSADHPQPQLTVRSSAVVTADRERLATVFGHLVQNAQEATADDGEIAVSLDFDDGKATILVKDTGNGMSDAFIRDRLFKPFESTKGLTGMGIGAFESREYVRQLGGEITVCSEIGLGSEFAVTLPAVAVDKTQSTNSQSCDPDPLPAPESMAN